MSRVYESDECTEAQSQLWEANARRAFAGKKGRAFLRETERALLAMPEHRLITDYLVDGTEVCILGAVAVQRGIDKGMTRAEACAMVPEGLDERHVRIALGISRVLAWELMYQNDGSEDYPSHHTPEKRWEHCLAWIRKQLTGATR